MNAHAHALDRAIAWARGWIPSPAIARELARLGYRLACIIALAIALPFAVALSWVCVGVLSLALELARCARWFYTRRSGIP